MNISTLKANRTSLIFGLIALLFLISPLVSAAGLTEAGVLSNGPSFDLVESNGYLYVAQGSGVRVYDISNRATIPAMTFKSYLAELPVGGPVHTVTVDGQYLYIAAENKFVVADISRPSQPMIVSSLVNPIAGTQIFDVVIKGNYAYLIINGGGVQVIDITNRAGPIVRTKVPLAGYNKAWRATIDGNYLYVGLANDNRMDILDISIPTTPQLVGSYKAPSPGFNSTSAIAVKNGYAYIIQYYYGVRVVDVSNPNIPSAVGPMLEINGANDIRILDNKAYVSARYQGINIIDISNPKAIAMTGKTTDAKYYNEGIYVIPGYTFMAMESLGFGIYDTASPAAPKLLTRIPVMGGADSLVVRDNTMYIGAHNEGIWTVDVADPTTPKELALTVNLGRNRDISLQDNLLYVAGDWSKLGAIDVSSRTNPQLVNQQIGNNIRTVLADGKYVYTEQGIIDFTNPSSPVYIAESPYFYGKFAKYGDRYLLVAASESSAYGLHILDVSNKKNPVRVATFSAGTPITDVVVSGNVAVAISGNSVITIDIANVYAPTELNRVSYPGTWLGYSIVANSTLVYAAGLGEKQVRAFDISDPSHIKLVDSLQLYGDFESIDYNNGYIYAGQKFGIHIIATSLVPTPATNRAPVLVPIGDKQATIGTLLAFTVNATDPDGDALQFSAGPLPENASFKTDTRTFAWIPMLNQSGTTNITFVVSDGKLMDTETIVINFNTTNLPPVLNPIGNKVASVGSLLTFTVNATDPDGDALQFSAGPLPENASFKTDTRTFAWMPMLNQSGTTNITFVVSDGKLMDTETIVINFNTTNLPPVLNPIGNKVASVGSLLTFTVNATDPDGDALQFSAGPLPENASFIADNETFERTLRVNQSVQFSIQSSTEPISVNASFNTNTRTFSWVPNINQSGKFNITFGVSDGKLMVNETIVITVNRTNHPPVLDPIGNKEVRVGSLLSFTVNATDPDGDPLQFSVGSLPANASFNINARTFAWSPIASQAGTTNITFRVSDGKLMVNETIVINVNTTNHAPALDPLGDKVVNEGESLSFIITATDADNDKLTFWTATLPYNASFDKTTREFAWVPTFASAGMATIKFLVSDGSEVDSRTINITVNNVNRAPYFIGLTNKTVIEGASLTFTIAAADPDYEDMRNLSYYHGVLPEGAQFSPTAGVFSWIPRNDQVGVYQLEFMVSDGNLENRGSLWVDVVPIQKPFISHSKGNSQNIHKNIENNPKKVYLQIS